MMRSWGECISSIAKSLSGRVREQGNERKTINKEEIEVLYVLIC